MRILSGEAGECWCAKSGLAADGALLVRPDGYVAWRAPSVAAGADGLIAAYRCALALEH
jgi:hypothetical protein